MSQATASTPESKAPAPGEPKAATDAVAAPQPQPRPLMTQLAEVGKSTAEEIAAEVACYTTILRRQDNPQARDAQDLIDLAAGLGISMEQVEKHAAIMREVAELEPTATALDQRQVEMPEAMRAYHARRKEIEQTIKDLEEEVRVGPAAKAYRRAEAALEEARRAQSQLDRIHRNYPELFGHPELFSTPEKLSRPLESSAT